MIITLQSKYLNLQRYNKYIIPQYFKKIIRLILKNPLINLKNKKLMNFH